MNEAVVALYLCGGRRPVEQVHQALRREFERVRLEVLADAAGLARAVGALPHDVVLADYWVRGQTGIEVWNRLEHGEETRPFVVLLDDDAAEAASIDAMRSGVSECVFPEDVHRLGHTVAKLLELWRERQARRRADAALEVSRHQLLRLTQQLHTRVDEERAAIAREIHDDIGGALAAVKFDLAWIARRSADEHVKERVEQAIATLQQALDASQRIMLSLRPAILDEGLLAALQWLVSAFQKRTGAEVVLRCQGQQLDVPVPVQTVAFSVVREALTNVVKHAKSATRVVVEASAEHGVLTVEVSDNGPGLVPGALQKSTSFGILGLRERAESVGGWLDVSASGKGVSVILTVPLEGARLDDMAELVDDQRGDL